MNGTWLSDEIDWSYDFEKDDWDHEGCTNPYCIERSKEILKTCENSIGEAMVTDDGGCPRCWWGEVLGVGMSSQWPYYEARPTVIVRGVYEIEWLDWLELSDIYIKST